MSRYQMQCSHTTLKQSTETITRELKSPTPVPVFLMTNSSKAVPLLQFFICVSVVHMLFVILSLLHFSSSFAASGMMCFVILAYPRIFLYIFFYFRLLYLYYFRLICVCFFKFQTAFCCDKDFLYRLVHIGVGGVCLLAVLLTIYLKESAMITFIKEQYKKTRHKKAEWNVRIHYSCFFE